jgi:archaellum component FlaC
MILNNMEKLEEEIEDIRMVAKSLGRYFNRHKEKTGDEEWVLLHKLDKAQLIIKYLYMLNKQKEKI